MNLGNLSILGHNYNNNTFFSNLHLLNIGDEIILYDIYKNAFSYKIFQKNVVKKDDLSVVSQDTAGEKVLTLITCDNKYNKRLVIKANL